MVDIVPGVTLQLNQVTTAPAEITIEPDLDVVQKNIQSFVDAYNALNTTIADATKYNAATKTGGPLQGDATTLGLQTALRSMLGSSSVGSTLSRLSDAGIERQTDGSLKINTTKLTTVQQDLPNLKNLFATNNSDALTNGFGLKVRDFARSMVAFDGQVTGKSAALQATITRNSKDQDRVNERASRVEAQLYKQYSALDAQMAQLNGLNSFVTAQLAVWNKSTA
jgi:flagellar hook-associated protein 2